MRCKEGAKCSICKYPSGYYIRYAYEQMHKYLIKKITFSVWYRSFMEKVDECNTISNLWK